MGDLTYLDEDTGYTTPTSAGLRYLDSTGGWSVPEPPLPDPSDTLDVEPEWLGLPVGVTDGFTAYHDGSPVPSPTWKSSDTQVATIDPDGEVSTLADGVTIITATSGAMSGTAFLTVSGAFAS